jgi:hypothetical protein
MFLRELRPCKVCCDQEPLGSEPESDSDFEYEGGRVKKGKGKKPPTKSKSSVSSPNCIN